MGEDLDRIVVAPQVRARLAELHQQQMVLQRRIEDIVNAVLATVGAVGTYNLTDDLTLLVKPAVPKPEMVKNDADGDTQGQPGSDS